MTDDELAESDASCDCGHPRVEHDYGVGECYLSGCKCRKWEAAADDHEALVEVMREYVKARTGATDQEIDELGGLGAPAEPAVAQVEAGAKALEDAADAINRDFQALPSWNESWRAGERTQDWESGATRTTIDTIDWLRARAAELRAKAGAPVEPAVTNERVEAARIAIHAALAPRWMSVVDALAGDQGEYAGMLRELARAALVAALEERGKP